MVIGKHVPACSSTPRGPRTGGLGSTRRCDRGRLALCAPRTARPFPIRKGRPPTRLTRWDPARIRSSGRTKVTCGQQGHPLPPRAAQDLASSERLQQAGPPNPFRSRKVLRVLRAPARNPDYFQANPPVPWSGRFPPRCRVPRRSYRRWTPEAAALLAPSPPSSLSAPPPRPRHPPRRGDLAFQRRDAVREVRHRPHHLSEPRRVTTDVGHHEVLHAPLLYFDLLRNRVLSDFVNHKASAACWACIGRVLDDVWTTVTVIGLNSHQR